MRLPGIGQAKAEAILADCAANGPYAAPWKTWTRVKEYPSAWCSSGEVILLLAADLLPDASELGNKN